jgi:hypothetical protein
MVGEWLLLNKSQRLLLTALSVCFVLLIHNVERQAQALGTLKLISSSPVYTFRWSEESHTLYFSTSTPISTAQLYCRCWHKYDVQAQRLQLEITDLWPFQPRLSTPEIQNYLPTLSATTFEHFLFLSPNSQFIATNSALNDFRSEFILINRTLQTLVRVPDIEFQIFGPESVIWSQASDVLLVRIEKGEFYYIGQVKNGMNALLKRRFVNSYPEGLVQIENARYFFEYPYDISASGEWLVIYAEKLLSDYTHNLISVPAIVLYNFVDPSMSRELVELPLETHISAVTARFVNDEDIVLLPDSSVFHFNLANQTAVKVEGFQIPSDITKAEFSPDGSWLAFTNKLGWLYVIDLRKSEILSAR